MATGFWKRLEPGSLKKRVTFCRQGETTDSLGKVTNGLDDVITLWADIYPVRGQEYYEIRKIQGKVTHKCYCRYHTAIADMDSTWYIKHKGKKYSVESVVDGGYDRKFFEIYCTEHIDEEEMPDEPAEPDDPGIPGDEGTMDDIVIG